MAKKLYVGNLSYDTTDSRLQELFTAYGTVVSVNVITDRNTGRSKGFAFVEMETDEGARAAVAALNEQDVDGRPLKVAEARPQEPRMGGGDRGGYRGGGGGGGGDRRGGSRRSY